MRASGVTSARRGMLFAVHVLALAVLLFHYHRYVPGLVSLPFFAVAVAVSVAAAAGLGRTRLRAWAVVVLLVSALWAVHAGGVAVLSRMQAAGGSFGGEGVTASFDRGLVAALPGIVVGFLATFAVVRRPRLYAWHPLLLAPVVVALFWSQGRFDITLFGHPSVLAATVTAFVLLEVVITMTATVSTDGPGIRRRELVPLLVVALPLLLSVVGLTLYGYTRQGGAAQPGGGLIRPTLLGFDFSDYISLESEISLSRDLVLLYREESETARQRLTLRSGGRLLRRLVLSGYDPRRGFYADTAPGEREEPHTVGESAMRLPERDYRRRSVVRQEYYLVNFDPSSLVSVNYPLQIVPYEPWADSSFARIYEVESRASDATAESLSGAQVPRAPSIERSSVGGADWYRYYTDYGGNEAIAELAREVTEGIEGDYARAAAIERYFLEEYYYSLRPGVAADGDQLSHFLFDSRKGYCSYFAFSMTLMARSLGLPARVAVGFFVAPEMSVMDYHAIRADLAHAWVEIYFEDYGWIEFDPTSTTVAPGEEFSLDPNLDMEQISALLEELIDHRDELRRAGPASGEDAGAGGGGVSAADVSRFLLRNWHLLLAALYLAAVSAYRFLPRMRGRAARTHRGAVTRRFGALLRELDALGLREKPHETVTEYAARLEYRHGLDLRLCAGLYLKALFGAEFDETDYERFRSEEHGLRAALRGGLPVWRQAVAFLAPYLHLAEPAPAARPTVEGGVR
jgi:transglutaminase-like putative cysteine protease